MTEAPEPFIRLRNVRKVYRSREQEFLARQQMRDRDAALLGGRANVRDAMRGGFEMGGQYRGTGGQLKMSIDPALDIPKPSYPLADD